MMPDRGLAKFSIPALLTPKTAQTRLRIAISWMSTGAVMAHS
jgi:hypothetical protein